MNTLFDIAGVSARIFHLPNREPFMTATDLAEVYGTSVMALNQAVTRNPTRFPDDFMFELSEAEMATLKSQNVISNRANRALPKAFTQAGAYALSAVLKTPIAAEVSVVIFRAFAANQKRLNIETDDLLKRLMHEAAGPKSLRVKVILADKNGWTFQEAKKMARGTSVEDYRAAIHEAVRCGVIAKPLVGTPNPQPVKPSSGDGQMSMFGGAS